MAWANGVERAALLEAVQEVFAARLAHAVTNGELPAYLRPSIARYGAAQADALLDLTAADVDIDPPTATEFGYPCLQITCLAAVDPRAAASAD